MTADERQIEFPSTCHPSTIALYEYLADRVRWPAHADAIGYRPNEHAAPCAARNFDR